MQKIIIDINVLVSSLIQRSYPYLIVREIFDNKEIELCISDELFEEYVEVLKEKNSAGFQILKLMLRLC